MEDYKRCPFCDELILVNAKKCKHCGEWLSDRPSDTGQTWTSNPDILIRQALAEKYELLEAVGTGGMATVYKAVQKSLGRVVALKVIHQNLVHDQEFVKRFLREAQLSSSLSHPNIVTVYDVGSSGQVHYIAMEYLEGEDLHQIIKKQGALPVEKVIQWIIPIAEALNYIHKKGLLHRDVKSPNIFITREGRPVLTDFGIAHAAEGTKLTQMGSVMGTPEYMSPEQAKGEQVTAQSDLWSLGVVMYEALAGKAPFSGDNPLITIHLVTNTLPKGITAQNPDIPKWLESIVENLLAKKPQERFANGSELAVALQERKEVRLFQGRDQGKGEDEYSGKVKGKDIEQKGINFQKVLLWAIGVVAILLIATVLFVLKQPGNRQLEVSQTPPQEVQNNNTQGSTIINMPSTITQKNTQSEIQRLNERAAAFEKAGDYLVKNANFKKAIINYDSALVLQPRDPKLITKRNEAVRLQRQQDIDKKAALQQQLVEKQVQQQITVDGKKMEQEEVNRLSNTEGIKKHEEVVEVGENVKKQVKEEAKGEVYIIVEEMPEFPDGGEAGLRSFIAKSIEYPVVAQENGIQGKVYVTFVVDGDGSISDAKVVRGVDPSLDKEALRVVNSLPKWKPGKQRGKPVRVSYTVPISFVLQ